MRMWSDRTVLEHDMEQLCEQLYKLQREQQNIAAEVIVFPGPKCGR